METEETIEAARTAEPQDESCDVAIAGCGVAGLFCALTLPVSARIVMLSKGTLEECDSMLAQGGICVQHDDNDYKAFFEDTLRAGHYENRRESVKIMIQESRPTIKRLIDYGVEFARTSDGSLAFTREGAHSRPRILFHADITGKEITTKLLAQVKKLKNVEILENTEMVDLIERKVQNGTPYCAGIVAVRRDGTVLRLHAHHTLLATGGIGGLFTHSTNYPLLTGDGVRIAKEHGVALEHTDYIQIHPTSLWTTKPGRSFLISESCRGEGAVLLNGKMERFTDELQPRDVVSAAIHEEMKKEGTNHVWLSFKNIDEQTIRHHFKHIYERCLEEGYDITKEPIPVVPAQHYFMGGIHVGEDSETTMNHLFAAGETSCNGVHGKNRLASNSLLESLVFSARAAKRMISDQKEFGSWMLEPKKTAPAAPTRRIEMDETMKHPAVGEPRPLTPSYQKGHSMDTSSLGLMIDNHIREALAEDMPYGDVSTEAVMPRARRARVQLICKQQGILAGIDIYFRVYKLLDASAVMVARAGDGDEVMPGQVIAEVEADVRALLSGERTALNYLQRMSGIATYTHEMAQALQQAGAKATLVDTRKTTPGMRYFEKMAVRIGGGTNHRFGLSDAVMLKDNHIAAAGGIRQAVAAAKRRSPFIYRIEVECETIAQVKEAVAAHADVIMLDNMTHKQMKEAIKIIDGRALTECSGNITLENAPQMADLGIDYISSGALTHSAGILDLSNKNLTMLE